MTEHKHKHDIAHLEAQIKELSTLLATVGDTKDLVELAIIVHKPGWTTIAEQEFVRGTLNTITEQAKVLLSQRKVLLDGSRAVGSHTEHHHEHKDVVQ